jgi:hypothetical protein
MPSRRTAGWSRRSTLRSSPWLLVTDRLPCFDPHPFVFCTQPTPMHQSDFHPRPQRQFPESAGTSSGRKLLQRAG